MNYLFSGGEKVSKGFKRVLIWFIAVLITVSSALVLPYLSRIEPQMLNKMIISSGRGDASNLKMNKTKIISLSGEWEFYLGRFIVSENNMPANPDLYIQVPSSWTDYKLNGVKLSNGGMASYRALLSGVGSDEPVLVSVPNFPGACRVYINKQCVYSNRSFKYATPNSGADFQICTAPVTLRNDGKPLEIVVEVDCEFSSGLTSLPMLSTYERYQSLEMTSIAARYLFIGVALFFALLTLMLSIMTKDSYKRFWLCALCAIFVFKLLISEDGYTVSHGLFFNLNFEVLASVNFVLTYIVKLAMMMHIVNVLELNLDQRFAAIIAGLFLVCAFFPYFVYDQIYVATTYMMLQSVTYVFDIYMIWRICGAVVRKHRFSVLYLVSYCITAGAIVLDNFNINGYVSQRINLVMPLACTAFICCATVVHAVETVEAFNAQKRATELTKELAEVNMTLMLSQIQPHFLYNALNTIKYLTKKDPKNAEAAIVKFSSYLRANMDSLTQRTPIDFEKELDHVKNYADIEQLRFGDRLKIEYDISASNFKIPPLTLQPIVENAIKHGVNQKPEGGTVKISTREERAVFVISVVDDGVGFDVNEVANDGKSHVGIKNIKVRLKEMCGASVDVKSERGTGTSITVTIPKAEEEINNENFSS